MPQYQSAFGQNKTIDAITEFTETLLFPEHELTTEDQIECVSAACTCSSRSECINVLNHNNLEIE